MDELVRRRIDGSHRMDNGMINREDRGRRRGGWEDQGRSREGCQQRAGGPGRSHIDLVE